jgi:3-hydroxyisobutyrate dehydrogenase
VLNSWLAFLAEGLAETVALADGLGVTTDELRQTIAGGPLAAPYAVAKLAKIANDDYTPEFPLLLALKDVDLALASAPSPLPGLAAISKQWHRAVGNRLGDLDISAARLALQQGAPTTVGG